MQYKGTLQNWKDEQGFGFAVSEENAEKVFVHIKNFSHKSRRPVEGDVLIYQVTTDQQGRKQAVDIQFLHDFERQRIKNQRYVKTEEDKQLLSKIAAYPFIAALITLYAMHQIHIGVIAYYVVLSVITFLAYWNDKNAAQNNERRTPEKTLHNLSFLGGWMGAILAQLQLRHKSQKQEFRQTFWLTVLGNIVLFTIFVVMTWSTPL